MSKSHRRNLKKTADTAANGLRLYCNPPYYIPYNYLLRFAQDLLMASQSMTRDEAQRELELAEKRFRRYRKRYQGLNPPVPSFVSEIDPDTVV